MSLSVAVIGGGPGGLFAARLLALRHPTWVIKVYDRFGLDGTPGFGIGLSGAALELIASVDPETRGAIERFGLWFAEAEFRMPSKTVKFPGFTEGVAISRPQLRRVLVEQAVTSGVDVVVGRVIDVDDVRGDVDLVVAADGVFSQTRQKFADAFKSTSTAGRGNYLWCGVSTQLPGTVFEPVLTEHGVFTAHAYPYQPGHSTLVIETDDETLRNAGFAAPRATSQDDDQALATLSEAFSDLLGGMPLRGNRSQWFHFETIRCQSWIHENIALVGDAAATADPSLGSGTRLAMASAIALADSLDHAPSRAVDECIADYDAARRPIVSAFQDLSVRSQRWWDSFPKRMDMHGERLAVAFLTRAGAVSLDAGLERSGAMVLPAVAAWAQVDEDELPAADISSWILGRPLTVGSLRAPTRHFPPADLHDEAGTIAPNVLEVDFDDPWGEQAAELVERAADQLASGAPCIVLGGDSNRNALLGRLQVAERIRLELEIVVGVEASREFGADVAAALIAGRIDFGLVPDERSQCSTPGDPSNAMTLTGSH